MEVLLNSDLQYLLHDRVHLISFLRRWKGRCARVRISFRLPQAWSYGRIVIVAGRLFVAVLTLFRWNLRGIFSADRVDAPVGLELWKYALTGNYPGGSLFDRLSYEIMKLISCTSAGVSWEMFPSIGSE
jgi:hypothetical protein